MKYTVAEFCLVPQKSLSSPLCHGPSSLLFFLISIQLLYRNSVTYSKTGAVIFVTPDHVRACKLTVDNVYFFFFNERK